MDELYVISVTEVVVRTEAGGKRVRRYTGPRHTFVRSTALRGTSRQVTPRLSCRNPFPFRFLEVFPGNVSASSLGLAVDLHDVVSATGEDPALGP